MLTQASESKLPLVAYVIVGFTEYRILGQWNFFFEGWLLVVQYSNVCLL